MWAHTAGDSRFTSKGNANGKAIKEVVHNVTGQHHQGGAGTLVRFVVVMVVSAQVHVPLAVRIGKCDRRPVALVVHLNITCAVNQVHLVHLGQLFLLHFMIMMLVIQLFQFGGNQL